MGTPVSEPLEEDSTYLVHNPLCELSAVSIVAKIQSKPFSHPIECAPVNTENLCRFNFISLGFLQHPDEMTLLDFLKRQTPLITVTDRPRRLLQRELWLVPPPHCRIYKRSDPPTAKYPPAAPRAQVR